MSTQRQEVLLELFLEKTKTYYRLRNTLLSLYGSNEVDYIIRSVCYHQKVSILKNPDDNKLALQLGKLDEECRVLEALVLESGVSKFELTNSIVKN